MQRRIMMVLYVKKNLVLVVVEERRNLMLGLLRRFGCVGDGD